MTDLNLELHNKLKKIKKVFNTSKIISRVSNLKTIARYYKVNKLFYTIFVSNDNFIHMGISRSGKLVKSDLLEHAKLVEKYIIKISKVTHVLELATGRGATSAYLAEKYPNIRFDAVDLPDGQLDYAIRKSKKLINFKPVTGDYHDLSKYKNNTFDLIFIIEALCHSTNKDMVFKEVKRVLKKRGVFIIFDGYSGKKDIDLTKEQILAKKLTEKGMMVNNFDYYPDIKRKLIVSGFKIIEEEDVSMLIIPTLKKYDNITKIFFSLPISFLKFIIRIVPEDLINNFLSGAFLPTLIKMKIANYMITVVES